MNRLFADEQVDFLACWLQGSQWLSRIFSAVFARHQGQRHNADYAVCVDSACRLAWALENWLWYNGKATI